MRYEASVKDRRRAVVHVEAALCLSLSPSENSVTVLVIAKRKKKTHITMIKAETMTLVQWTSSTCLVVFLALLLSTIVAGKYISINEQLIYIYLYMNDDYLFNA